MQNGKEVTTGLVLRVTETKEADKILTVLTPDMGKIPLIARGARRKNSRIAAASQLLAYSELTLYKRGNWHMLDEASTLELFDGVRQDIVLLSLASYFAEAAEAVCAEETTSPEILSLLLNALYAQRKRLAGKQNIPAFMVFSDATLREMVQSKPLSMDEFLNITGVGEKKAARYGMAFLRVIEEMVNSR